MHTAEGSGNTRDLIERRLSGRVEAANAARKWLPAKGKIYVVDERRELMGKRSIYLYPRIAGSGARTHKYSERPSNHS